MKCWKCLPLLGLLALGLGALQAGEGTAVKLGSLTSKAPGSWKAQESSNKFRSHQFTLPRAEGDPEDAELVIFNFMGGGGSVTDNISRWKKKFIAPRGKTIDEVSSVATVKIDNAELTYLDIHGTYLDNPAPFNPKSKDVPKDNFRMLSVVFDSKDGPFFIRLTGPAKTVEQHKSGFDNWLKAFK